MSQSYAQTCAQILMMGPWPLIAKVFTLVVQEERQCAMIHGMSPLDPLVFNEILLTFVNFS